ncbi:hypothetical protein FC093_08940 [Ilyomonas limi]|uniref:Uncharacterized protein n=1 Tax=Ilyomonas limi TaxID=2575867 RepID=A0A4U3L115_9BACT|nr:hypothetical protein [Ilyomonas limi]TKK68811.1 hypothetical protein FC093_08940 [Ilyomonas limi]
METQNNNRPVFNGKDEQQGIKKAAQKEQTSDDENVTQTQSGSGLTDSIRNYGEVSGTTFGDQSNPVKFSNIGGNNRGQQDDSANLNDGNRATGNGDTGFSHYLYEAEKEVVSGTRGDALNSRPSDAMQGSDEDTNNKSNGS